MDRREYLTLSSAVITGLAGCIGDPGEASERIENEPLDSDDGDDHQAADEGQETTGSPEGSEGEDVSAVIGDRVEGDRMHLVVEGFERDADLGEFREPDSGNEFVVAWVALKNVSEEYVTVSNLLQVRIGDDEDYQYDPTFAGEGVTFDDGQFAPGEVERGGIPFEIPEDATGLTLVFDFDVSTFGGVDRAEIDLESETDEVSRLEQCLRIDVHEVGDAVSYSDVEVTVNEARVESEVGQFAEPDPENEFVVVDVSVTNDTGEQKRFSTALQMMVKDGEGYTYQEDLAASADLDQAFDEGTPLSDGETRRGEVVYEVPEGRSPLYWVFEFELFETGDKTFWRLREG